MATSMDFRRMERRRFPSSSPFASQQGGLAKNIERFFFFFFSFFFRRSSFVTRRCVVVVVVVVVDPKQHEDIFDGERSEIK